ncbi:hypothetical protein ACQJBY_070765 [Aegilops geniculata]
MAPELGWWPMSPWLSPGAASFIFFNVLVGAIAVMSSSRGRGQEPASRRKLVRTASTVVLESLRSISNFPFHSLGDYGVAAYSAPAASQLHHVQAQYYSTTIQEQEAREVSGMEPEPASVAQQETVVAAATTTSPQSAPVAAPAGQDVNRMVEPERASVAPEETAAAATTTTSPQSAAPEALDASAAATQGEVEAEESISLDEAYALARAGLQSAADTAPKKAKGRGAYGCGRGTEEVDARAEQFIRQFREELKLERINSILNHTHALRRTAGAR